MVKKTQYSSLIGAKKTGKNVLVMFGLPAILYVLSQVTEFVPEEQLVWAIPLSAGITYFIKNYLENK